MKRKGNPGLEQEKCKNNTVQRGDKLKEVMQVFVFYQC